MTVTRESRIAIGVAALLAASSVHAAPQPKSLVTELKTLGTKLLDDDQAVRDHLMTCLPPQGVAGIDKLLTGRIGQAVTVLQICDQPDASLVSFWFTKADHHDAQIVRISNDQSTVTVLASWKDMKNCDAGMCDHFSTTDSLVIANATDLDGDGDIDPVIDFATTTGDQGHESHRLSLWPSKTKHLVTLGDVVDRIERLETFPDRSGVGIAVSTRTFNGDVEHGCFNRGGALRACPMLVQAIWKQRDRRLEIARDWSGFTDASTPPDAKTLAGLLTELGVTSEEKARLTALATK
ncbi:MAG TPA: hypothetical protein VF403_01580 [Kofleriaceae bacterium]